MARNAATELLAYVRRDLQQKRPSGTARPLIFGLAGAQGSGKSTIARRIVSELSNGGIAAATMSIDDFYLSRAERRRLAAKIHPLFVTRGPPGTHDIAAAGELLDELRAGRSATAPVFDKSRDDIAPRADWRAIPPGLDVLIFEGWCVGARPQDAADLVAPINTLERIYDGDGIWRRAVNNALHENYQPFFDRLDALIYLRPPSFEIVSRWRFEQENELSRTKPRGVSILSRDEISYFIQHYERITRWMMNDMPSRADLMLQLNDKRDVIEASRR